MYQVLYRKYRPKIFDDVVGQPQVTVTLKNELNRSRVSHAYLFTGSRGTGKTSCAKILSKAINCLSPINGNPCCECDICRGIDNGTITDVVEIDAASNNGVDNIRDLIEESAFTPNITKYRVYIIDEVHMLSMGAFNALLKTLEEPPKHIVFILATTEIHKIPATILSRCQRLDFHRIKTEDLSLRLKFIADKENISLTDEAAILIASVSDGCARDALSLLDQCIGRNDNVSTDIVRETAGIASKESIFNITDAIFEKDTSKAIKVIGELYSSSKDMAKLCEELAAHFRAIMLIKTMKNPRELIIMTDNDFNNTVNQSKKFTLEDVVYYINSLQDTYGRMSRSIDKRIEMEMTIIKLCAPELNDTTASILSRISKLELAVKNGVKVTNNTLESLKNQSDNISNKNVDESKIEDTTSNLTDDDKLKKLRENARLMGDWQEVIEQIKNVSPVVSAAFEGTKAYISGNYLLIDTRLDITFEMLRKSANKETIRQCIENVTGKKYKLGPYRTKEELAAEEDPLADLKDKINNLGDVSLEVVSPE